MCKIPHVNSRFMRRAAKNEITSKCIQIALMPKTLSEAQWVKPKVLERRNQCLMECHTQFEVSHSMYRNQSKQIRIMK